MIHRAMLLIMIGAPAGASAAPTARRGRGAWLVGLTQPPQPKLLVRPYPRSSWQYGPAEAGTVASAAMAKARAKTILVIVVSYGLLTCITAIAWPPFTV